MTLRELVLMAEGRSRAQWSHTAALMALIANCHRDPRRRQPYAPADFLPPSEGTPTPAPASDLSILKAVFVDRHAREPRP